MLRERRLLAQKARGVGGQAGFAGKEGVLESEELLAKVQVGEGGKGKRGLLCKSVSGKVPLPLGTGRSLAASKAKNKCPQLLSLEFSQESQV